MTVFITHWEHGEHADLAMIQKTIIYTLHKKGKSQRVITEGAGGGGGGGGVLFKECCIKVY